MFYAYIIIDIFKIKKNLASHESDNHLNNNMIPSCHLLIFQNESSINFPR